VQAQDEGLHDVKDPALPLDATECLLPGLEGVETECGLSLLQRRADIVKRSSPTSETGKEMQTTGTISLAQMDASTAVKARSMALSGALKGIATSLSVRGTSAVGKPLIIGSVIIFAVLLYAYGIICVITACRAQPNTGAHEKAAASDSTNDLSHKKADSVGPSLRWYHLAIVMGISLMDNFSTDFYVPNMPTVAMDLHTDSFMIGLSLQINLCMRGVSSLVLGFLSDRVGRVKIVALATAIYTVATCVAMSSTNISMFLAARAVQGAGEGVVFVCDAIVRDAFPDVRRRMQTLALMGILAPLAVVAAPAIGGIVGAFLGWRAVFAILAANGAILTILTLTVLPETTLPARDESGEQPILVEQVGRILFSMPSMGLLLTFTLLSSNIFSMLSNISFVLQETFGASIIFSSLLIGIIPSANIVACGVLKLAGHRLSSLELLRSAMLAQVLPLALLLGASLCSWNGIAAHSMMGTVAIFWCMIFANGLCFPGLNCFYLEPFKDIAGLASGINGLCQSLLGAWIPALGTAATVSGAVSGLQAFLGSMIILSCSIFWTSFGVLPPAWSTEATSSKCSSSKFTSAAFESSAENCRVAM